MISNEIVVQLLKAIKTNNLNKVDDITYDLIKIYEKKGYHKVSKKLREIKALPFNKGNPKSTFISESSLQFASNKTLYELRRSHVKLKDIVLSNNNLELFNDISQTYIHKEVFQKHGIPNESKILLYGPPGTGKTLFAYVLAGELGIPVLHVYIDVLISSYLGETGRNIRSIFNEAQREECIIFLDEFDAIGKKRDDERELGELKRSVSVLLQNIDELNSNQILVAATNHDELLDKAIRRRFTYELNLDVLDQTGRKEIFKLFLKDVDHLDFEFLSRISEGFSGAYIHQSIFKALRKWYLSNKKFDLEYLIIETMVLQKLIKDKFNTKDKEAIKIMVKTINKLRAYNKKKYTYKYLESLFNMPDSTLQHLVSDYGN